MNWPISRVFRNASLVCLVSGLAVATTGCEDANDLGVELPGTSPINTEYNDYRVNASTILQDSVETLNADRVLVGRLTDATLGTTTAKALFNLRISGDSLPGQFTAPKLDSVVLVSGFDQVYGSSQPVSFNLYTLGAPLDDRKTYNAGVTNVALSSPVATNLIGSLTRTKTEERAVAPGTLKSKNKKDSSGALLDSTVIVTLPDPTVRLVLQKENVRNSDFANTIFNALKDPAFDQTKLNAIWPGLAIGPSDNHSGSIVSFTRFLNSRVYFYFRGTRTGATTASAHSYAIRLGTSYGNNDANAPRYYTQIATALKPPFDQLADGTKSIRTADSLTYMQEGIGLATKLTIPGLNALKNQPGLAINRAELIIPVKSSGNVLFPNPLVSYLYELNAKNRVLLRTVNISSVERVVQANLANPLGAGSEAQVTLYDVSPTNKYYSVVITSYLQAYLANQLGEQAAALMLSPVLRRSFGLSLNRSVLDAQNIKLRVYSSKLR